MMIESPDKAHRPADIDATLEAARCLMCKKPKCVEGCPVEIDIPGFINFIADFAN